MPMSSVNAMTKARTALSVGFMRCSPRSFLGTVTREWSIGTTSSENSKPTLFQAGFTIGFPPPK